MDLSQLSVEATAMLFRAPHANEKLMPMRKPNAKGCPAQQEWVAAEFLPGAASSRATAPGQHQSRVASFFTAFDILQPPLSLKQSANQSASRQLTDANSMSWGLYSEC